MPIQEILQQIISYLKGMWRFRWFAMVLVWIVAVTAWVLVMKLPDEYIATARVQVNTDSVLRPLLRGLTIQTDVSQRLQLMTKTLLNRQNLEKIASLAEKDYRAKMKRGFSINIPTLKKSIKLKSGKQQNLYTIAVKHNNRDVAISIAQALLKVFVEDTMGQTRTDTDSAQKFLMEQIKEHEERLMAAEERIKEFKKQNLGELSGEGGNFFSKLQEAQTSLSLTKLKLNELRNRRNELKRQLEGEEPVFGLSNYQTEIKLTHDLDQRIEQLKLQANELLLNYTEKHPKVSSLRETIKTLEARRDKELMARPPQIAQNQELQKNPVYQQIKISLSSTEAEISTLEVRVDDYKRKVSRLKKLINTIPENEAKLRSLNRDFDLSKKNYDILVARLETAKLSEKADMSGEDVKFKVIDPPRSSATPAGPNRTLFGSVALVFAIGVGLALSFVLSQIRPAIYDQRTLKEVSGFPVFGAVSQTWTKEALIKKRVGIGIFASVVLLLLLVFGGVLQIYQNGSMTSPDEIISSLRSAQ